MMISVTYNEVAVAVADAGVARIFVEFISTRNNRATATATATLRRLIKQKEA